MYLKVDSVSAVEITTSRSSSSSPSLSSGHRLGTKIPVPLRQGGGAAAAVAAAAATADGAACTPDEIYCYTQSNSNRSHQYHHYPSVTAMAEAPTMASLNRGIRHPAVRSHYSPDPLMIDVSQLTIFSHPYLFSFDFLLESVGRLRLAASLSLFWWFSPVSR